MSELMVAIAILMIAVLPIAYSYHREQLLMRSYYTRAAAMEIVDGEMEVLMAGEWHNFTPGTHPYTVKAQSLVSLPPGQFTLTIATNKVRLEWQPESKDFGGPVSREGAIR
jgi:hypothetical protein